MRLTLPLRHSPKLPFFFLFHKKKDPLDLFNCQNKLEAYYKYAKNDFVKLELILNRNSVWKCTFQSSKSGTNLFGFFR